MSNGFLIPLKKHYRDTFFFHLLEDNAEVNVNCLVISALHYKIRQNCRLQSGREQEQNKI